MPNLIPTSELVITKWLNANGVTTVGPTLPQDATTWATNGYIQTTVVGGAPSIHTRLARPVIQLDFWAANQNSAKAPWNRANQLAEMVRDWAWKLSNGGLITIGGNYQNARLLSAYFISEPRRMHDPNLSYARYTADLQAVWTY